MSEPPVPQTNLSEKFAALQLLMTTQHEALLTKIDAMRGVGPENTLKSINQSIWNMVGAAPGATLVQLLDKLTRINNGVGGFPDGATLPGGLEILSLREQLSILSDLTSTSQVLLTSINGVLGGVPNDSLEIASIRSFLYNTMQSAANLAACCATLALNTTNPMLLLPSDMCPDAITSDSVFFVAGGMSVGPFSYGNPVTLASWKTPPLPFYLTDDPSTGNTGISVDEWSNWRIYVASTAPNFGVLSGAGQRFTTNTWVVLSGSDTFRFFVDGEDDIKVYICEVGDEPPPDALNAPPPCVPAEGTRITSYVALSTWTYYDADPDVDYTTYAPTLPTVPGLLINMGNGIARVDPSWNAAHPNGWVEVHAGWDFSGNEMWPNYARNMSDDIGYFDTPHPGPGPLVTECINSYLSPQREGRELGQYEYIQFRFTVPASSTMPHNFWLTVTGLPGM